MRLLKTYFISLICGIIVGYIVYAIITKNEETDFKQAISLIIAGSIFLNIPLALISIPSLFVTEPKKNVFPRLILYFSGPIIFSIGVLFSNMDNVDKSSYLLIAGVFTAVHSFFYFRMCRNT